MEPEKLKKGVDYTGVTISFFCHDGEGNFVMHRRNENCRDEHGRWDFGGGGLEFGETFEQCLIREIKEEYGTEPINFERIGVDEIFREHEGRPTHWVSIRYKAKVEREKVINNEPHKHDELTWVTLDALPSPLHSQLMSELEKYRLLLER